ncbi:hypothetical protein JM93_03753 [Roseibium hamelinense]|uniref:4-hydroxy-3-methylbut-2-en-1-yl diphosphate synthase n=1 Tax=Roseibium hamelinense TaxID=150831 RepID=A0A562SKV2_9HYPH|nr:4-hydroxy-3-methylbut-2-en-1-yl diphosphate synthase [Roseibium hamelinense]MTI43278.1 4-hydroxy-3-methylbut-2-en-1-yl diphosphate synthase [Roseibium hamelinense]TWI81792.1 hypothetical protein JM93_03753 [Roseibium hamelinense]
MFFTVLERSVSLAQHNIGTLFRTGWAYILLLVALNFAIGSALAPNAGFSTVSYMTEPVTAPDQGALRLLALLANVLIGFSIAIAYVRKLLIGAQDFPVTISSRTFKVIINQIVLSLIGIAALIPLVIVSLLIAAVTGGLGVIILFAAPFVSLMVVQRFSVVLPAAAVDDPLTLKESWRATSGLGWAMAFSALIMSLLALCLVGIWALVLTAFGGLLPADPILQQIRSAAFPMGTMLISVWVFASLHATFYGLIRERFAEKVGLRQRDMEAAAQSRDLAREKAARVLSRVNKMGKDR